MKHKILIVDDEVKLLDRLKRLFENDGHRVVVANTGNLGLEALKKDIFDLVITDLVLPEGDGYAIMNYVRENCPETVIIVITGHASVESAITAMRNGAYDYIIKPFRGEVVKQAVKRACEKIDLQRDLLEATKQLQLLAITDALTGLYNQRYFKERLAEEFERTKRYTQPLSCLMIYLDNFKKLNDTYGHLEGDKTLRKVAHVIKQSVRSSDFIARYGGDEFVLLLPQTPSDKALMLAERIQSAVAASFVSSYEDIGSITISLGYATAPHAEVRKDYELVSLADKALYNAKRSGRNRIETFKNM